MKISKSDLGLAKSKVTETTIHGYLEALNCPRSLSIWMCFKYNEHQQIVDFECKPEDYSDAIAFRDAYQATSFLSKADFLSLKVDRKVKALEKFDQSEARCLDTNRRWRLRSFANSDWNAIHRVSRKIVSIIGYKPNIDEWVDSASWGPGASLSIKRGDASSFKKFRDERGITVDASVILESIDLAYPYVCGRMFQYELGDKVVVVPKNAKIDRVILVQPGWNLWFQKGLGKMIRRRLYSVGLDLDHKAAGDNVEYARLSSIDGSLATCDFTSASDCLAIEPLREVMPPAWFRLLDLVRSKRSADGSRTWNKFSSMGNGFTFELETLLFYTIALVACDLCNVSSSRVSVFGDDVIVPIEAVDSFRHLSELFGFALNDQKTFFSGYFRESCGSHWYNGVNCKPVFLKRKISDAEEVYKAYNRLRESSHIRNNCCGCDSAFMGFLGRLKTSVVPKLRLSVPYGFGDVGFISNFDEATPMKRRKCVGWQGYFFRAIQRTPISFTTEEPPLMWVRLTERSDTDRRNNVDLKSRTRVSIKLLYALEWYNLGCWY